MATKKTVARDTESNSGTDATMKTSDEKRRAERYEGLSNTEAHLWRSAKNAERLDAAIAQSREGEGHFVELDHLFAELGIDVED